jgi:hypothetical protein
VLIVDWVMLVTSLHLNRQIYLWSCNIYILNRYKSSFVSLIDSILTVNAGCAPWKWHTGDIRRGQISEFSTSHLYLVMFMIALCPSFFQWNWIILFFRFCIYHYIAMRMEASTLELEQHMRWLSLKCL